MKIICLFVYVKLCIFTRLKSQIVDIPSTAPATHGMPGLDISKHRLRIEIRSASDAGQSIIFHIFLVITALNSLTTRQTVEVDLLRLNKFTFKDLK
jgi:hypothetical protein